MGKATLCEEQFYLFRNRRVLLICTQWSAACCLISLQNSLPYVQQHPSVDTREGRGSAVLH